MMQGAHRQRFLVVDGDDAWQSRVALALSPFGGSRSVSDAPAAVAAFHESSAWIGIVLEAVIADGSGFDLLTDLRALGVTIPALMLTGFHDRDRINRAHSLQAEFLCKPPEEGAIASFARRAVVYHWTRSRRIARILDAMALDRGLTPREAELVAAAVAGMPRRLVAEELGVSENTLKVQVRLLLVKCQANNLDELADVILRRALRGSGARPTTPQVSERDGAAERDDDERKVSG
jgi:FixJ family two-component response regulator